jgi:hypothetical protein
MVSCVFNEGTSMMKRCRPLALAAALQVILGVGSLSAQSVIVRNAPPGSTVEAVLNTTSVGTAKADAKGDATIPLNLSATLKKNEIDANIFLDVCDTMRRVVIVERGQPAARPADGCERRDISGLYLVRRVTTLVVSSGGVNPSVLLVQGSYDLSDPDVARPRRLAPTGFVFFGAGELSRFSDARVRACGEVGECDGGGFEAGYTVGVDYWILPYVAAEVAFMDPGDVLVDGRGGTFRFSSFLNTDLFTAAAKVGGPIGQARLYGRAGVNFHVGTFGTTQTTDDETVTIDGVPQTIPGGTVSYELKTEGWGWLFGGGLEIWIRPSLAIFTEVSFAGIKGDAVDAPEGSIDDRLTAIVIGGKFRFGGQ